MPSTPTEAKTTNLTSLIERLENADGPSRELDALIWCVEHPEAKFLNAHRAYGRDELTQVEFTLPPKRTAMVTGRYYPHAANVTASIDSAVALATRLLPGWRIKIQFGENYSIAQFVRGWGARADTLGVATSERPDNEICLALVTATLRALSAQEGSK